MKKETPILFTEKSDCCGCAGCASVCPNQAICMEQDECGFWYPVISETLCINCKLCEKVCIFNRSFVKNTSIETYAGVIKDSQTRKLSSSGGIFVALSEKIIEAGGVVIGATLCEDFSVQHIIVDKKSDLKKLQGSKYVQSDINKIYIDTKHHLEAGKTVLFSGTPCQVGGLYGFLGKKPEKLVTVDIVCHGVPNIKMFKDYIMTLENKYRGKLDTFIFRDKNFGWGLNGSFCVNQKKYNLWQYESSYMYLFSKGWLYRECCYSCQYASENRVGDITLGDYWGIEKQHPEYLRKNIFNENEGISLVIVNTESGKHLLQLCDALITLKPSSIEKAKEANKQLSEPSNRGKQEEVMLLYSNKGWSAVEEFYKKEIGFDKYISIVKRLVPTRLKKLIKRYK